MVLAICMAACLLAGSIEVIFPVTAARNVAVTPDNRPEREKGTGRESAAGPSAASQGRGTATTQVMLGEFSGSFDEDTGEIRITSQNGKAAGQARVESGISLPGGSYTVRLTDTNGAAPDSIFLANPGITSAEIEILNNSSSIFYNTKLLFVAFRNGGPTGTPATNSPNANGIAFYNDGQLPWNNQLHVSRNYGDIQPGTSNKTIWTFAIPTVGPTFHFTFVILADIGVAAESVEPAAVQVNGSTGTTININGRGFSGTPTVQLLNSGGSVAATLTGVSATTTQVTATVPANTAAGIYSVRVINPGGAAGGVGSSTAVGRLTVTGEPTTTMSGLVNSLGGSGPYLVNGNLVIGADVVIPAGTVLYFASGVSLQVASSGNLLADGGIPEVGSTAPSQIVLTAQRAPGQAIPARGAWGGVDATSARGAQMIMRNCVVEYGGVSGGAAIKLTNSGRRLRFTDSVARRSGGAGVEALGSTDLIEGFARSKVDYNNDVPLLISGGAAVGLYDLDGTTGGTSVADANYYFSSCNTFTGNTNNYIQIGTDANAASNDFPRSGVLVGQGSTPIHIRGNAGNPAVVGGVSLVELSINPAANINLASGVDLQAGDTAQALRGGISANGLAGVTQVPGAALGSSKYISFDRVGGANWGSVYFSRNAPASSILNFVSMRNGGSSALGNAAVLAEGVAVSVTNSEITNSTTGSVLAFAGGNVVTNAASLNANLPVIDTIAGGNLGDGNPATMAQIRQPSAIVADPLGRGLFVADADASAVNYIRFINTTTGPVTVAGIKVGAQTVQTLAGRETGAVGENIAGLTADLGSISGLAASPDGKLVYFVNTTDAVIRALNVSAAAQTVAGGTVDVGRVRSFADLNAGVSDLVTDIATTKDGDVLFVNSDNNSNKVYKITVAGRSSVSQAGTVIAGRDKAANETNNKDNPAFLAGPATSLLLFQPRSIETDAAGNVYVADTGHGRVIKLDTSNNATLISQFTSGASGPYPSSLAVFNNNLYAANGNQQVVMRLTSGQATVAGTSGTFCQYDTNVCGDGGAATSAAFSFQGSNGATGISANSSGLFILDQVVPPRGRIRFLNLSAAPVTLAGVTINANAINTVAGSGLPAPYDSGLATSSVTSDPTGVAVDANNNVWFTDTGNNLLRFLNRGISPVTLFAGVAEMERVVPPGYVVSINNEPGADDGVVLAKTATLNKPQGLAITAKGIFLADSLRGKTVAPNSVNSRRTGLLRFINTSSSNVTFYAGTPLTITIPPGHIGNIAGGGSVFPEDLTATNTNVTAAVLIDPTDVAVSADGNSIYVTDAGNNTVRKID
ncbi:MAG: hypothetical protein ACKV2V_23500, partial [Blastocatellia bacterium]